MFRKLLKEYNEMTKKMRAMTDKFVEEVPVDDSGLRRAIEIFNEELKRAELPLELKIMLETLFKKKLEEAPDYIS